MVQLIRIAAGVPIELRDAARKYGLNMSEIARKAIEQAVKEAEQK